MRFRDPALIWTIALLLVTVAIAVLFIDRPLADAMATIDPQYRAIGEWVTTFGRSPGYLIGLAIAVLAFALMGRFDRSHHRRTVARQWAWACVFLFLTVALSGLANDVVKTLVGRPRPAFQDAGLQPFAFDYKFQSFPSGHAATVFGLAFGVMALWPRWRWLLLAFAIAVAASRVVLHVHYLGDTIGSVVVALLTVRWLVHLSADHGIVFRHGPDGTAHRRLISIRQLIWRQRKHPSRRITPA